MAQAKPTRSVRRVSMMGRTTPPTDEPETMTPRAAARRLENQPTSDDMQPLKTALEPTAPTSDCASRYW